MFTVPVITPDLRHEETIIQAACALECLQKTIDTVFEQLDARITNNNRHLVDLTRRIETATQRIQSLSNVKTAIQLYAPASYPATEVFKNIPATFKHLDAKKPFKAKYVVKSRLETTMHQDMQDKLLFFHVRETMSTARLAVSRSSNNASSITLGAPPTDLHSSAALLRFNSDELAYFQSTDVPQTTDNWRRAKLLKDQKQAAQTKQRRQQLLEPAPHSLLNRNQRATPAAELRYTPQLHEPPAIDLPLDLPTLPGVAQNIRFEGNLSRSNVMAVANEPKNEALVMKQPEMTLNITVIKKIPSVESEAKLTIFSAPPPPPPPPPPAVTTPAIKEAEEKLETTASESNETRSALMDAIRKAGGARGGRLRSAAAAPLDAVDNKSKNDKNKHISSSGGDLMADLHNKLLMRRKGISGVNTGEQNPSNSVLLRNSKKDLTMHNPVAQRLSALIPPPPPKMDMSAKSNTEDDDDDWS